ncbi:hypothetical protein C7B70_22160 [Chlorogloea sp. CCALA 695]|nr:hypothetical protein C7B70_22160 [Chlorogloea sp. CCALA 695]
MILNGEAGLQADKHWYSSDSADSTVKIWNLATNELIYTLTKHIATVQAVAFSPNGNYLATAGSDRIIHL